MRCVLFCIVYLAWHGYSITNDLVTIIVYNLLLNTRRAQPCVVIWTLLLWGLCRDDRWPNLLIISVCLGQCVGGCGPHWPCGGVGGGCVCLTVCNIGGWQAIVWWQEDWQGAQVLLHIYCGNLFILDNPTLTLEIVIVWTLVVLLMTDPTWYCYSIGRPTVWLCGPTPVCEGSGRKMCEVVEEQPKWA